MRKIDKKYNFKRLNGSLKFYFISSLATLIISIKNRVKKNFSKNARPT